MDSLAEFFDPITTLDWRSSAVWIPLLLGLIGGWGLEFLLDALFWRRRTKKARSGRNDLQFEIDALKEDRKRALKDAEGAQTRVAKLETASSRLATDLRKITSERNQLQNDLDVAVAQVSESADTQMSTPDVDVDGLQTRAEEAETRILDLEAIIEEQKQSVQNSDNTVAMPAVSNEADQTLIAQLREQLTVKEDELTALKMVDPEPAVDSGVVTELQQRIQTVEADAAHLRTQVAETEQLRTQLNSAKSQITQLESSNQTLLSSDGDGQTDELRRQLQVANAELFQLRGGKSSEDIFAAERAEFESQLKAAEAQISQAKNDSQAQVNANQSELDRLRQENTRISRELNSEKDKLAQAVASQSEADQLRQENARVSAELNAEKGKSANISQLQNEWNRVRLELQERIQANEVESTRLFNENETILGELSTERAKSANSSGLESRLSASQAELSRLSDENDRMLSELQAERTKSAQVAQLEQERDQLLRQAQQSEDDNARLQREMSRLQTQAQDGMSQPAAPVAPAVVPAVSEPPAPAPSTSSDDFLQIDGMGYVFARRLQQAGVTTFAQLASKSPSDIENIVKPQSWQSIDVTKWIDNARDLSGSA